MSMPETRWVAQRTPPLSVVVETVREEILVLIETAAAAGLTQVERPM